jgi:AcrR family transcriptional regulator
MAGPSATVNHPRADALVRRIAGLEAAPDRRDAVALGLVDGVVAGDGETLAAALDALRDARARADGDPGPVGWLDAAVAFAHWGLERVPSRAAVARATQAHGFLRALEDAPGSGSAELRRLLEVDETQVSRTGRRLLDGGLVSRRKVGREVFWDLTPRGRRALEEAPARRRSPGSEFWRQAIRRGFEAAAGDEPGEPRAVDPTRERVIACTLELHQSRGIRATTWEEIAGRAGVPVETVTTLFPTHDALVQSCGEHLMESLRLPPADRARDVFAGASSEHDRIRSLVATVFGAYERGGDGIAAGRRERNDVPVVDESLEELDTTFDALVVEALRPRRPDNASVASVRALTDLEVWRGLREGGATPGAAVDRASTTVERWLEARPAR